MEATKLAEMLNNNMNKILTPSGYKRILNKKNNLVRYDIINRMLIDVQSKDSFDLKTYDEWLIEGRKVKDKAKPIYIIKEGAFS